MSGGRRVRAEAGRVLAQVLTGRSLDRPLQAGRDKLKRDDDRALLAALCYGALRHAYSNRALVRAMLRRPDQKLDPQVEALLLIGVQQIRFMRTPAHAAVAETVAAATMLGRPGAKGLINALLRRFIRERDTLEDALSDNEEARFEHPAWLLAALRRFWPDHWQAIVEHNNLPAPMWLRVNLARTTVPDYEQALAGVPGLTAERGLHADGALKVAPARSVEGLPGFSEGDVTVQDQSAQLAASLLDPRPGERILDACAAPGGKTGHLLERAADLDVVALDCAPQRLERLREGLTRLGLKADVHCADLATPGDWQALAPFDRILLDAPCTGSGVIRRHPDIKVLRRADDSDKLAVLQGALLRNAWQLLKPGGVLLYATCSVLPTENDAVIAPFLADTPEAACHPLEPGTGWGRATQHGRQVFPGEDASDGFYYAYIRKRPE